MFTSFNYYHNMKRPIIFLYTLIALLFCSTACIDLKQETTFNADGSGTFSLVLDLSKLQDNSVNLTIGGDSLGKLFTEENGGIIDTTASFRDMKEEIGDVLDNYPKLQEKGSIRVYANQKTKDFILRIEFAFESFSEIPELFYLMDQSEQLKKDIGALGGLSGLLGIPHTENAPEGLEKYWKYKFSEKGFSYKFPTKNRLTMMKESDRKMAAMLFNGSDYEMVYHFPKRIKTVKNKDAVISPNRKTVVLKTQTLHYWKGDVSLNNKIVFE